MGKPVDRLVTFCRKSSTLGMIWKLLIRAAPGEVERVSPIGTAGTCSADAGVSNSKHVEKMCAYVRKSVLGAR